MKDNIIASEISKLVDKIVKGSLWILLGLIIAKLMILATHIMAANYLSPESYGLVALAVVILMILTRFLPLGLHDGLTRFLPRYKKNEQINVVKSCFSIAIPISIVVSIVLFFISDWLTVVVLREPSLSFALKIFCFAIPFAVIMELLFGAMRGYQKPRSKIVMDLVKDGILLLVVIGFVIVGIISYQAVSIAWAGSFIIAAVVGIFLLLRIINTPFSQIWSIKSTMKKKLMKFSYPLLLSAGLVIIFSNVDKLMIAFFLDSAAVGNYELAYRFANIILMPLTFLGFIFYPIASKLLKEKKRSVLKQLLPYINKLGTISVFPIIFLFIFYPSRVIELFVGAAYPSAALVLQILTIGYLPHLLNGKTGEALKSGGYTKAILYMTIFITPVNIVLNWLLIPRFGVSGAALSTGISFFVFGLMYIFSLKKLMKMSPFSSNYYLQMLIGIIVCLGIYLANTFLLASILTNLVFLITNLVLFYLLFLLVNYLFGFYEENDKILVKKFMRLKN